MIFIIGLLMSVVTLYLIVEAIIDVIKRDAKGTILLAPMSFTTFVSLVVCIYGTIIELGG